MKLGIHKREGSFSDRWIEYCNEYDIPYKLVNAYSSNIIEELEDCKAFMWHWNNNDYRDHLFARQLIYSLEMKGVKTFPNSHSCWHFDDKVGQKYLLEALGAPLIHSEVFYSKNDAKRWLDTCELPKVFKLRGGAGSINVKLITTKKDASALINKAFSSGFDAYDQSFFFEDALTKFKKKTDLSTFLRVLKWGFYSLFGVQSNKVKLFPKQAGYVYFQDFVANQEYDTRLLVIGKRCFAVRRYNRKNDFRASGSGVKGLDPSLFDKDDIRVAFETTEKLRAQCVAYDFVKGKDNESLIIEISYGSPAYWYDDCNGYFNRELEWVEGKFKPQYFMMEDFINSFHTNPSD